MSKKVTSKGPKRKIHKAKRNLTFSQYTVAKVVETFGQEEIRNS